MILLLYFIDKEKRGSKFPKVTQQVKVDVPLRKPYLGLDKQSPRERTLIISLLLSYHLQSESNLQGLLLIGTGFAQSLQGVRANCKVRGHSPKHFFHF